jgi:hypothetical protein
MDKMPNIKAMASDWIRSNPVVVLEILVAQQLSHAPALIM